MLFDGCKKRRSVEIFFPVEDVTTAAVNPRIEAVNLWENQKPGYMPIPKTYTDCTASIYRHRLLYKKRNCEKHTTSYVAKKASVIRLSSTFDASALQAVEGCFVQPFRQGVTPI